MLYVFRRTFVHYIKPTDVNDTIGYFSAFLSFLAIYLLGEKVAFGWLVQGVAGVILCYVGFRIRKNFMIFQNAILALLGFLGWFKWVVA